MDLTEHLLAAGTYVDQARFLGRISGFLASYYVIVALINAGAAFYLWRSGQSRPYFRLGGVAVSNVAVWSAVAVVFLICGSLAGSGIWPPSIPGPVEAVLNKALSGATGPVVYTLATVAGLSVMFVARRFFVKPAVAWSMLNLALLFMGASMTNHPFWLIVSKADNVPIVGLIFLLGFFTWLATHRAVINDDRIARGEPPLEKLDDEKVLVWPDLVYTELICMVALTALLLVWAILLPAPLEQPASSVKTPNPSKAPWYFLGLQEMLVYYDPWFAGVVAPSMIIIGLMAIPYIDFNKRGMGYYTINERKFAYITFQFGFLVLWVTLIVLGTFLRGPNWNFYGPYEAWDPHRVEALNNTYVSHLFWYNLLDRPLPMAPPDSGGLVEFGYILLRESPGILLVLAYFVILPPILAMTVMRQYFIRMGFIRFMLMVNLLLFMLAFPIKMVLRWTINLKYVIKIDEYFLNF